MARGRKLMSGIDEAGNEVLQIIVPRAEADGLSLGLRMLTYQLEIHTGRDSTYGLGGSFGYGLEFENETFLMKPYCWCERDDCLWCVGCECFHPETEHYVDGERVNRDEAWELEKRLFKIWHKPNGDLDHKKIKRDKEGWDAVIEERNRRFVCIYPERRHSCMPHGLMTDHERGTSYHPSQTAPYFWHKKSGFKVWWYKYIGRDNETNRPITWEEWLEISRACLASIGGPSLEECAKAYDEESARREQEAAESMQRLFEVFSKVDISKLCKPWDLAAPPRKEMEK